MNTGAERYLNKKHELIGKQRVSLFSPGAIVLQNSLMVRYCIKRKYSGKTIFINKEGKRLMLELV